MTFKTCMPSNVIFKVTSWTGFMFENVKLIQFFLTIPSTSIATERSSSTKVNNNSLMPIEKQIFIYKKKIIWKERGIYHKTKLEIHVKINWLVIKNLCTEM